jgi:phenylacetate-CoA ligase
MKRAISRKNLWERAPAPMKAVVGSALKLVPLPYLLGRSYREWYAFLRVAERWDTERAREYQFDQLRRILTLAYHKSPFYREQFRSVGFEPGDFKDLGDMERLPTIDKETIRANADRMLTVPVTQTSVDYVSTSGSGGVPLGFYMDSARSSVEFAHLSYSWGRIGYRPGDVVGVLRGQVVPLDRCGVHHRYDPLLRYHYFSSFHLMPEQMTRYVDMLHRIQPRFMHSYLSSLFLLCRFMHHSGLKFPVSIRGALLGSEPVYPFQRAFIEREFGLKLFSWYGHSEKLVLAAECEESSHYHVWPTYGYCEVLTRELRPAAIGVHGEIVGTSFMNEVMPFIRYRTDDFATAEGLSCSACGRHQMLLSNIEGHRAQEFLVTNRTGVVIAWTALNMHDDTFDGIMRFQFRQRTAGVAELRMVPTPGRPAYNLERIRRHLDAKLNGLIEVKVTLCHEIPPLKSGKKPMVVQEIPDIDRILGEAAERIS